MLQQLITNRQILKIKILSLNIIKKLPLKTSKLMKLSKNYSFKKSKSNEIFSFKFPFIDNRYQKMTLRVGDSPSQRVNDSPTQRVDSPTRGVAERKNARQQCRSRWASLLSTATSKTSTTTDLPFWRWQQGMFFSLCKLL